MSATFRWTWPMSTRGSIAICRQRYRCQRNAGQGPEAVAHPGIADHVRLHGEHERRDECGRDSGGEPPPAPPRREQDADEDRKSPGGPEERSEQTGLHAELRVVRLPRFDRGSGTRCSLARVAETVALRMMDHGSHAFAQADPVAVQGRLVETGRIAARARLLPRVLALLDEVRA